ncbi:unnamed protein product [Rotaria sp. Silwood1]|nr:unnamed protein product [Rotaria sp. Silwood1]
MANTTAGTMNKTSTSTWSDCSVIIPMAKFINLRGKVESVSTLPKIAKKSSAKIPNKLTPIMKHVVHTSNRLLAPYRKGFAGSAFDRSVASKSSEKPLMSKPLKVKSTGNVRSMSPTKGQAASMSTASSITTTDPGTEASLSKGAPKSDATKCTMKGQCVSVTGVISHPVPRLSYPLTDNSSMEMDTNEGVVIDSEVRNCYGTAVPTHNSVPFDHPKIMDHRSFERHVRNIISRATSRGNYNHQELERMYHLASYFLDFHLRQAVRDAQDDFNNKFNL